MDGWAFLMRYVPWLSVVIVVTLAGVHTGQKLPEHWHAFWLSSALILLILLEILKKSPLWNSLLLLALAYAAGGSLAILGHSEVSWVGLIVLFLGWGGAWWWAYKWRRWFAWLDFPLAIVNVLFGVGWVLLWVFSWPARIVGIWAGVGLGMTFLLMVATLKETTSEEQNTLEVVVDLYILGVLMYALGNEVWRVFGPM